MTATLTVDPNPVPSGGTSVTVDGSGFEERKTRLLLEGVQQGDPFYSTGGVFSKTLTVSSTETTQHIVAEQCVAGSYLSKATATVTIEDAPPGDTPFADMTGWRLVFADEFDRTISEGHFVDGGNYSPPGVSGIKTADGRYVVYKDGWKDTTQHGRYDPSIISVDGSKMRYHVQTRDGYPRVANMHVLPSGSDPKGGLLGLRYHIRMRSDPMANYKVVPLLWASAATTNADLQLLGEIDFPEGETIDSPHGFVHHRNGVSLSDQTILIPSPDTIDLNDWHDYVVEWRADTSVKAYIDAVQIGSTVTDRIPNTAMSLRLQVETMTGGAPIPSSGVSGYVEFDRVAVWAAV